MSPAAFSCHGNHILLLLTSHKHATMDHANLAAAWTGALATIVGLSSIITQTSIIQEHMDPFFPLRDKKALGCWILRQPQKGWSELRKPILQGPIVVSSLDHGFCGQNDVHITRRPFLLYGTMSWTAVMGVFHPRSCNPEAPMTDKTFTTKAERFADKFRSATFTRNICVTKHERHPWFDLELQVQSDTKTQQVSQSRGRHLSICFPCATPALHITSRALLVIGLLSPHT